MKKIIALLCLAAMLCFSFAACDDGYESSSSGYYDNKGRQHSSQYEADVWNDVDDWMAENW